MGSCHDWIGLDIGSSRVRAAQGEELGFLRHPRGRGLLLLENEQNFSREIKAENGKAGAAPAKDSAAPRLWLNQPSIVGMDERGNLVAGSEARERSALEPGIWTMQEPVRGGTVADPALLSRMLQQMLRSARLPFLGARTVCLVISGAAQQREIDTVLQAVSQAGLKRVKWVRAPIAAARQAGLELDAPLGQMVLSLGAGATEAAIVTMNDLAVCRRAPVGGNNIDEAIAAHLRRSKGIVVGLAAAEELKRSLAGAIRPRKIAAQVWGRDLQTGLPRSVSVTGQEICTAIAPVLEQMLAVAKQAILEASADLAGDLAQTGVLLWGGSAQLYGMGEYCRRSLGIPVRLADHPTACAAAGAVAGEGGGR